MPLVLLVNEHQTQPSPVEPSSPDATSEDLARIFGPLSKTPQTPVPAVKHGDGELPSAPTVDPNAIKHVEDRASIRHVETQAEKLIRPKVPIKARTEAGINYAAAFLLFCKGISLQEIADEFGIKYGTLVQRSRDEDWDRLAKKADVLVAPPPTVAVAPINALVVAQKQEAILKNRSEAHKVAVDLRANIVKVLRAYEVDNTFLRPDDILTLAKAAKLVDDAAMLALGDEFVTKNPSERGGGGGNGQPSIVINLPSAVSRPREPLPAGTAEADQGEAVDPAALHEVTIVGRSAGEKEAVAAKTKRGHSVNFDALQQTAETH